MRLDYQFGWRRLAGKNHGVAQDERLRRQQGLPPNSVGDLVAARSKSCMNCFPGNL
jgi:hypothetical protein